MQIKFNGNESCSFLYVIPGYIHCTKAPLSHFRGGFMVHKDREGYNLEFYESFPVYNMD